MCRIILLILFWGILPVLLHGEERIYQIKDANTSITVNASGDLIQLTDIIIGSEWKGGEYPPFQMIERSGRPTIGNEFIPRILQVASQKKSDSIAIQRIPFRENNLVGFR